MKPKSRRIFHRLCFAIAALGTLAVLFYTEENWRGARAWAAAKRDLKARGESVDLHDLIPLPVPDEQNLAMAPLFVRLFSYQVDPLTRQLTFNRGADWYKTDTYRALYTIPWGGRTNRWGSEDAHKNPLEGSGNWMTGHALNLARVQKFYRLHPEFPQAAEPQAPASDVLLALTRYTSLLDELAQSAAERPQTRFPVNWTQRPAWGIPLPHYSTIQKLITTLRLRAVAELATDQTTSARRDIALMLRLRQTIEHEPTLISGLVDITCINILIQPVWEGLAARQWSAEDLDTLRDGLRGINVLREFQQGMRCERTFSAAGWPEDLRGVSRMRDFSAILSRMTNDELPSSWFAPKRLLWTAAPWIPHGWIEQNSAFASRYLQDYGIDTVDSANHRMSPGRARDAERAMANVPVTPYTFIAQVAVPVYASVVTKFAQTQCIIDQARMACALEHYYLDHHAYPVALSALVPTYLDRVPNDVIDGAPMRYRLTADGRFQLYSVAKDNKDDGGTIAWPPDRNWRRDANGKPGEPEQAFPSPVKDHGDWVWQYAPAEPPDPPANSSRLESLSP